MNLGKAIKLCRMQENMSQIELARLAGISVSYMSLLERGKRDPSFSTVEKVASSLKVPFVLFIFLAADGGELSEIDPELAEKVSYAAFQRLLKASERKE